jgi:hypothetical protein
MIDAPVNSIITICDLSGRLVKKISNNERSWTPGEDTKSGMYLFRVENEGKVEVKKALYIR